MLETNDKKITDIQTTILRRIEVSLEYISCDDSRETKLIHADVVQKLSEAYLNLENTKKK